MGALITVTDRDEDARFGETVAEIAGLTPFQAKRHNELRKLIKDNPDCVIFWDIDHKDAAEVSSPLSISNVGNVLRGTIESERIFVLSTQPLNTTPYVFNIPIFGHHIYRQYAHPAPQMYAALVRACRDNSPFGLAFYLPKNNVPKKIVLKFARERRALVEAIQNLLTKANLPPNLCSLASQATDELLMNAIFDAPYQDGKHYKRQIERSADFELKGRESVELEFSATAGFIGICVRDNFGALKKDVVLGYIRKDYEKQDYKVKEDDPGAGLGVYGILQSGMSMLFACKPNVRTEVMIFIPAVTSMKQFRTQFRFFSFV
jgi:hypothetical protein